jgi:hypothetical protein
MWILESSGACQRYDIPNLTSVKLLAVVPDFLYVLTVGHSGLRGSEDVVPCLQPPCEWQIEFSEPHLKRCIRHIYFFWVVTNLLSWFSRSTWEYFSRYCCPAYGMLLSHLFTLIGPANIAQFWDPLNHISSCLALRTSINIRCWVCFCIFIVKLNELRKFVYEIVQQVYFLKLLHAYTERKYLKHLVHRMPETLRVTRTCRYISMHQVVKLTQFQDYSVSGPTKLCFGVL